MGKHVISAKLGADVKTNEADGVRALQPIRDPLAPQELVVAEKSATVPHSLMLITLACLLLLVGAVFIFSEKFAALESLKPLFGVACLSLIHI